MTSSMPTSAATARAVVALSPVSSTGRRPSALSSAIASADVGLTVSATTNTAAACAVPAGGDRGLAALLGGAPRGVELGGSCRPHSAQQRGAAGDQRVPVDDALDAEALAVGEALDGGQRAGRRGRRAAIAWAIGCSEASSSAPTRRSASSRSTPSAVTTSTSAIWPVVTVPVLSSTMVSTRRVDSRTSGPLISRPSCAPRPVPTISAVGVASPSAQGQAMIRTATAAVNAKVALSPAPSQKPSVADRDAR